MRKANLPYHAERHNREKIFIDEKDKTRLWKPFWILVKRRKLMRVVGRVAMLPLAVKWSDLGSFNAFFDFIIHKISCQPVLGVKLKSR
ncbi:hypothetical protein HY02_10585 [Peptococcaceae bacterium SCADC1_2_3]|jgi:hypothetical protein|nr:hypothetical protein DK28_0203065 [Peptococcaceae bacterium SCADC1_2_3]KFI36852.1 hypothetical protein HY02_10585 [Peptococcaceae bacterium SCADC1_2_3]